MPGHKSALACGLLGSGDGVPVVAMLGRVRGYCLSVYRVRSCDLSRRFQFHPYEGHPLSTVVYPVRVMAKLGVKDLLS